MKINMDDSNISSLKITTFNMNGAGAYEKQKDVLDFLRKKKFDIIMLQETHWKTESENYIRSLWGYNCYISGVSTAKNGVAILFNNSFDYKVHNIIRDDINGRYIILDITIFENRYTITNVYGPSDKDNPDFFSNLFHVINNVGNQQMITGGDWNTILNPSVDARNYLSYSSRPRNRKILNETMENLDLVDIYRVVFPNKKAYTWRKFNTIKQSRLDYFIISNSLVTEVNFVDILTGYRSDHSLVCLYLNTEHKNDNKKSYWKFNNSLLKDKTYVDSIKNVIFNVIKQYAVPVYNFDKINDVSDDSLTFTIDDQLFFEILLLEIRGATISYSSHKKRKENQEEIRIRKRIEELELLDNLDHLSMLELDEMKTRLQEMREYKIQGMMLRSRLHWLQHGEKPSNYFCRLESRNFVSKRMCFLEKEDGSILYDQDEILEETMNFYKDLYQKRSVENVDLEDLVHDPVKLSEQEKASIEGYITFQEATEALKGMKNNKAPGNSGFTTEFFKFFFINIGTFLVRSLNSGFDTGKLSITQRQGVITCIPKEGKNTQYLKNWRPISLLNVCYKIASTCISNRIRRYLAKLISSTQKSFLSGRNINDNLKMMYDMLLYTENENIPGLLLLVDFQKAFDSISWDFIDNVLNFFNFGNDLKRWINVFYNDIASCVQVNNKYSRYFAIERGVRQGDALSAYLFLLCGEILSKLLMENDVIKGIKVNDREALLSQFADDTALFLDGSKESFEQSIKTLSKFAKISGLTINNEKTSVIWLGSKKNSRDRYLRDMNFTWDPGGEINSNFKYLGIIFSTNTDQIVQLNYGSKLNEIQKLLRTWSKRSLTPFGKITVIKTLAISKLTYLFSNIPDPSCDFLKQVNNLFIKFLWNDKPSKISFDTICQSYDKGGINMVNIFDYLTCIRVNCFKRYLYDTECYNMTNEMYPKMKNVQFLGNDYLKNICKTVKNPLLCDILRHVSILFDKHKCHQLEDIVCERLFYNNNIIIGNKSVYYRSWVTENVTQIIHLMKDSGQFLSYQEFIQKFPNIQTHFLQYNSLICSVRSYFIKMNITNINININDIQVQEPVCWRTVRKNKKEIKGIICQRKQNEHVSITKWNDRFDDLNWKNIFYKSNKTTIDTKLKWFQIRLIYRCLPTNRFLHLRKIKNDALCENCKNADESISHMFWECDYVQSFWKDLKNLFISKLPHCSNLNFDEQFILFGCKENTITDKPLDLFILSAKYHIYLCKFSQSIPNAHIFINQFKRRYKLEKYYNYNIENEKFQQMWKPYEKLVS